MRTSAASVAIWIALVAFGDARQAPTQAPQPPRFKSGVEVVELDLSVTDSNRRPVHGLTAAGFTVLEDGQPQQIVQFTPVEITDPPPTPTKWLRDVAPDVNDNSITDRRVFVILLDDAMIPPDPKMVNATKEMARSLVNRLGPSDLAAVVFTLNNSHSQDFTSDRARLRAAIDTFAPGFRGFAPAPPANLAPGPGQLAGAPPLPDKNVDTYYYQSSVRSLENVAELLTDVPHQRKILMYISVGVPIPSVMTVAGPGETGTDAMGQDPLSGAASQLQQQLIELFRLARLSNVNVYTFDPAGLDGLANYFLTHKDANPDARSSTDYLRVVAENTGGRAVLDTNNADQGVVEMVRESGSYYLVAYQSSNPRKDGKYRKVDVRVDRPGVTVRTRAGYNAPREVAATRRPPPATEAAVAGLLPRPDVQLEIAIAPFAIPGKSGAALVIAADVRQPTPADRTIDNIELLTRAFDGEGGKSRGSQKETARVVMRPTGDPQAQFEVLSRLDLKPGHYNLRFAAHSTLQDKTGSVYSIIDVPDFAKDPMSLSGVIVSATPATASAGQEALASLIPVMPTTKRTFAQTDKVSAFLRIYQHAKGTLSSVRLDIRVVDDHDNANFHATEIVSADRFDGTRTVDHHFDLPVASFAPGLHLLTIEATAGKTSARRDVRFVVR
jgi:VWFA-related protein